MTKKDRKKSDKTGQYINVFIAKYGIKNRRELAGRLGVTEYHVSKRVNQQDEPLNCYLYLMLLGLIEKDKLVEVKTAV